MIDLLVLLHIQLVAAVAIPKSNKQFKRWLKAGMRKRKRSAESAASTSVGGIATNKITTFLWKRKRKRH